MQNPEGFQHPARLLPIIGLDAMGSRDRSDSVETFSLTPRF
jgi:hypothetical protein